MGRLALAVLCACGSAVEPGAPAWRRVGDGPEPRWGHVAIYAGDRMLVYGGASARGELSDVWAFELATETWSELATLSPPPARINPGAVHDPLRDRIVIFAGRTGLTGTLGDVWALDLVTMTWTQLPSGPGARQRPHAATDGARAWFYGGEGTLARVYGDLWQLDLATDTWRQLPGDRGRTCGALVYRDDALAVTGGHDVFAVDASTWRYDLATEEWSQLATRGNPAAGAHWAVALGDRLYLAGGDRFDHYDTSLTDALALDTLEFSRVTTANLPPVRDHATLVFDSARNQLVLFGGSVGDGQSFLGDTWLLAL